MKQIQMMLMVCVVLGASSCSSVRKVQYGVMEKFGVHKRDLLVDRVEDARDAQRNASDSIQDAYKRFAGLVQFDGGDLESVYNRLKKSVDQSEASPGKSTPG
ncbi:MAG: hypothetical protein ACI9QL_000299 [Candidatus Omnitrophota bacterium]|jgi:hypothetical protein